MGPWRARRRVRCRGNAFRGQKEGSALGFVRGLKTREELAGALNAKQMLDDIVDRLWAEAQTLQKAGAATDAELQSKVAAGHAYAVP